MGVAVKFPLSIPIVAIDKTAVVVRGIRKQFDQAFAPLRKIKDGIGAISKESGLPQIKAGFSDALGAARNLGSELFSIGKRVALGAGVAGAAILALVVSTAHAGDEISKTSMKLGVSAVALQEWRYAADQSNVDAADFDQGLLQLSRRLGLVSQGNKAAAAPFARLGVNVFKANGQLREATDVLGELTDKFGNLRDSQLGVNLSMQLFGKSGASMIPLLKTGSSEIGRLRMEAHALGLVMSNENVAASDAFVDTQHRLEFAVLGVKNTIGVALLPIVAELATKLTKFIVDNRPQIEAFANAFAQKLPVVLADLSNQFSKLWLFLKPVVDLVGVAVDVFGPLPVVLGVLATVIGVAILPAMASLVVSFYTLGTAIATTPAGWILLVIVGIAAAIAALIVGVIALFRNWDAIWTGIKTVAANVWGWISDHLDFIPVVWVIKNWDKLRVFFGVLWTAIKVRFAQAWSWIKDNIQLFLGPVGLVIKHWSKIKDFFVGLWGFVSNLFDTGVRFIVDKITGLADLLPDWVKSTLGLGVSGASPTVVQTASSAPAVPVTPRDASSEARVRVDINGLQKGDRVVKEKDDGVDLELGMGFDLSGG